MLRLLVTALIALLLAAPVAAAQEDGVFVDPSSPPGQEYELPLEAARESATPKDGAAPPDGARSAAPAFGDGIEPAAPAGREPSASGAPDDQEQPARPRTSAENEDEAAPTGAQAERTSQQSGLTNLSAVDREVTVDSGLGWTSLLFAFAILGLGGILALTVRKASQRS